MRDRKSDIGINGYSGQKGLLHFGDNPTDNNWMALLICILNEQYSVNDALVAMNIIDSREDFGGVDNIE